MNQYSSGEVSVRRSDNTVRWVRLIREVGGAPFPKIHRGGEVLTDSTAELPSVLPAVQSRVDPKRATVDGEKDS